MKMQKSGTPLNDVEITQFEIQFQIELPQDYKAFMLKNNGGVPENDWAFDYVEKGYANSSIIRDFFVLYVEETHAYDDLKKAYKMVKEDSSVSSDFMPIATDPGGNTIFLAVGGENYGKVYFSNHELDDAETGYMVMSLIADSFSDFIDKCYLEE